MKKLPLICSLTAVAASSLVAQTPRPNVTDSALRQVQSNRQRQALGPKLNESYSQGETAPQLYPGESEDVGPQYLVKDKTPPPTAKKTWLEASVDTQFFYTSNMFLTEKAARDTSIFLTTAQIAIAPAPFAFAGGELALRAGYRHQRYMYGLDSTSNGLNNFDFDVSTVTVGARYGFAPNWNLFLGADYNRLLSHEDNWHEFYAELVPGWGLERQIPIGDNAMISVSYIGAYHISHVDPAPTSDIDDRLDSTFSLAWSWQFYPRFVIQPYYRFQYTSYTTRSSRNDVFHTVGANLSWAITDWASLRTFISWENRNSNDPLVADYQKIDGGAGLSLVVRF